jgi:alpha-galactosidase
VVPSYASSILSKKGEGFRSPWFYNTWEPFFQNYDASLVNALIPIASKMGLDIFTIDTGWSDDYAAGEPSKAKFPDGLDGVRRQVESHGMRLGMWVPLAVVSADSQLYREHPDWVMRDYTGAEKTADFPGKNDRVMCLASPYRDAAARRLNDLIDRYHPAYLKIDLTTVFNAYGEAPGCHASGHYHGNWAQSLVGIYEGIQAVTNQVYAAHPDIILDLTFELWGQKHIIDYGLLAAGDLDWMSNVDDHSEISAGPLQARTLLYHRALAIPAETMLIGNLRATTPNIEERFATVIGSAPVLLGDLRNLKPAELSWYGREIQWFKQLRSRVALNEGFFPLGAWQQPKFDTWDGYARLSHSGEGIIVLFQNQSTDRVARVSIPAYPDGDFTLQPVLSKQGRRSAKAQQLRSGIDLPFSSGHRVEIWEVCKSGTCSVN